MTPKLIVDPRYAASRNPKFMKITPRELEVLTYICHGYSNKEAAEELGLNYQTVKNHLFNISRKLEAKNIAHAMLICIKEGLIRVVEGEEEKEKWPDISEVIKKNG